MEKWGSPGSINRGTVKQTMVHLCSVVYLLVKGDYRFHATTCMNVKNTLSESWAEREHIVLFHLHETLEHPKLTCRGEVGWWAWGWTGKCSRELPGWCNALYLDRSLGYTSVWVCQLRLVHFITDTENKFIVTQGKTGTRRRDKLEVWDLHIHTTIYKIDKQQGPTT